MSISLEYLQRCSTQTGYAVNTLEKVVRLGEVAGDVSRHPLLGQVLALKGGTALNICHGPPQRLSVDLDFNYIGHLERDKMLEDRPRVEDALIRIATKKSYRIQRSADAFAGRKLFADIPFGHGAARSHRDRPELSVSNAHCRHGNAGNVATGRVGSSRGPDGQP